MAVGAILVGLILGGVVIAFAGGNPFASYAHIARASFGSIGVLSDTLVKATPILLTSLACSIAFRMKLWNIGAEGQFIMGAFGASAIALDPGFLTRSFPLDCSAGHDGSRDGDGSIVGLHSRFAQSPLECK